MDSVVTPKGIGDEFSLSVKTVSTYCDRILEKLKLKNNAEFMRCVLVLNVQPGLPVQRFCRPIPYTIFSRTAISSDRVPYKLIVIDSELFWPAHEEYAQVPRNTRHWRTIPPVVITGSQSRGLDTEAMEFSAIRARKSVWSDDLSRILLAEEVYDEVAT